MKRTLDLEKIFDIIEAEYPVANNHTKMFVLLVYHLLTFRYDAGTPDDASNGRMESAHALKQLSDQLESPKCTSLSKKNNRNPYAPSARSRRSSSSSSTSSSSDGDVFVSGFAGKYAGLLDLLTYGKGKS